MHVIDINVQFAKMKSLEERKEQQKGNLEKKKLKLEKMKQSQNNRLKVSRLHHLKSLPKESKIN